MGMYRLNNHPGVWKIFNTSSTTCAGRLRGAGVQTLSDVSEVAVVRTLQLFRIFTWRVTWNRSSSSSGLDKEISTLTACLRTALMDTTSSSEGFDACILVACVTMFTGIRFPSNDAPRFHMGISWHHLFDSSTNRIALKIHATTIGGQEAFP